MKLNKLTVVIVLFLIFILCYIIYFYPFQKYMAEKTFNEYIKLQGINQKNIESKEVFKDYKQGGYIVRVVYKDDLDYTYYYKYSVNRVENLTNYKSIRLNVYDTRNSRVNSNMKYPPIEQ